jgi:hypothetical protein
MTRREHEELQRKLSRARRLALEPGDALSRERAAQVIEDLEYQLLAGGSPRRPSKPATETPSHSIVKSIDVFSHLVGATNP